MSLVVVDLAKHYQMNKDQAEVSMNDLSELKLERRVHSQTQFAAYPGQNVPFENG